MITRRSFLTRGAYGLAGLAVAGSPLKNLYANQPQPLKVGIIGFGSRGGGIASIISTLPNMVLVACADIMAVQRERAQQQYGAIGYEDYRKLLDDKEIKAVIITLPEHLHYPAAIQALEAGKHVYLEKTMTHTVEEAERFVDVVATQYPNQIIQVGHQYRYFQLYHKVYEVIQRGHIGEVYQYECQYHRNSDWRRPVPDPKLERQINWRMYKEYSGGLMTELCAHQVDILNWFAGGTPLSVVAMGGIDYWKDGRETFDNIRAVYEYPNGVKASVSSILSNAYNGYSIRVLGTKGTIEIQRTKAFAYPEQINRELTTVDGVTGATAESWGQGKPMELAYQNQDSENRDPTAYALLDFVERIEDGRKPFSNVETGRDVAKAVLLANRAAETKSTQYW